MSLIPPILNPSSLYKDEAKRDATRIKIYNGVLTQIYNKVKAVARVAGNEKALWYVVPEFLPGYPRFDAGEAVIYIVWNLRNAGYQVEYTHPNLLYITWKMHDEKYHQTESPWSKVLQMVKNEKKEEPAKHSIEFPIQTHADRTISFSTEKPIELVKRKSILKKTTEYQPMNDGKPIFTNSTTGTLPGQLTEKHISFV